MQTFIVPTKFIFDGVFKVQAESVEQAVAIVEDSCGLVRGGDIHTAGLDDDTVDWEFDRHPEKIVMIRL